MRFTKLFLTLTFILALSVFANAQKKEEKISEQVRSSAAFAEVVLRTTELESELEELLVSYTEEFPKVKNLRYELKLLQTDLSNIAKFKPSETGKLTQALGKLLVRRATVATDHWVLQNRYNNDHPDTKKAKRKLEIFEAAIKKILG